MVLLLIGLRVAYLQAVISEQFLSPWRETQKIERIVPARSGRILARDGAVLAYDETRYDIAVDYRWLERPLDSVWLQREVYSRLNRKDRTDPEKRKAIELEIQQEQTKLFRRLAALMETTEQDLKQRAADIQTRVEKMVATVESRRDEQVAQTNPKQLKFEDGIDGAIQLIKAELTTPPRRFADDPIILKEELRPHVLLSNAQLTTVSSIQSMPHAFPGVHVLTRSSRVYPKHDLAAHLIGVRRSADNEVASSGQGGIEEAYDKQLAGKTGKQLEERSRQGNVVGVKTINAARDGQDLALTIDSQLQLTAEALLDHAFVTSNFETGTPPKGGVIIVLDLWTGDLLAAAAAPRVSLATLANPSQAEWQAMLETPNQPFFPRVTQMAIPPGSIFKIVTAAAALEEDVIRRDHVFHCQGFLHHPSQHRCQIFREFGRGHGDTNLEEALCQSCNVFFFDLAEKMGPQQLLAWAQKFGFGQKTGVDLPGESAGQLPDFSNRSISSGSLNSQTLQFAIGQGKLLVTPLQVTRMMAAIGNGGYLVTPQVVASRSNATRNTKLKKIAGLSKQTISTIQRGMEMVVDHPLGTGTSAMTPAMRIAAKTGTAETSGEDHAWFAGYAPAKFPRIAFTVVLEHGGHGGDAGTIVRELMTELMGLGYLKPQWAGSEG